MRLCSKCKKYESSSWCKYCQREYYKNNKKTLLEKKAKYYQEHKEEIKNKIKKYNTDNKEKIKLKNKKYYQEHKEEFCNYKKQHRLNNITKYKERDKKYYQNNKEKIKQRERNKRKNDPLFRISNNLRRRINHFLNNKSKKFSEYIGCSLEELKVYLESKFQEGMSLDKLGKEIHIDHIIPLSTAKTEEELYKLCHYTNLQPLWAVDNLKKGNKR